MTANNIFFTQIDGKKLECLRVGLPSKGRVGLIFLHEGLGCVDMWRDFPHQLCEKLGLSGFVYSRAGHGRSDPCDLPRQLDYMHHEAQIVLPKIIDIAGFEKVIVIGHSDGGSIGLIHAGSGVVDRVCGVVSLAGHVFYEEISGRAIEAAKQAFENGDLRNRLKKHHGQNIDNCFYGWNDAWLAPGFTSWNIEEFLPGIKLPVLAIQGVDDEYGSLNQVDAILSGVCGFAQRAIFENCGHSAHLQRTELTLATIEEFVTANVL